MRGCRNWPESFNDTTMKNAVIHVCSFVDAEGSGVDRNGKLWRWEFHEYCGPLFLKKNGDPLKNQPMTETHPAWTPFEAWLKDYLAKKKEPRPCC
jgi:hypothetical protein